MSYRASIRVSVPVYNTVHSVSQGQDHIINNIKNLVSQSQGKYPLQYTRRLQTLYLREDFGQEM